jgi:hypothetical protein
VSVLGVRRPVQRGQRLRDGVLFVLELCLRGERLVGGLPGLPRCLVRVLTCPAQQVEVRVGEPISVPQRLVDRLLCLGGGTPQRGA